MKKPIFKEREQDIVNAIIEYLRYKRFCTFRMNSGAIMTSKGRMVRLSPIGTPDILAIKDGKATFFEVKVGSNKPTFFQEQKMIELEAFGAKCFVVYSVEEVKKIVG